MNDRKNQIRVAASKTGKRHRGAANVVDREAAARARLVGHVDEQECAERAQKEKAPTDSFLKTRYPLQIGGSTKYEKKDLSIVNGDFAEDADGDLALVGGADALGQQLERAVRKANPVTVADAEAAVKACAQSKPLSDYLAEIYAVRSSGKTIEVDFVAFGYSLKTQVISF